MPKKLKSPEDVVAALAAAYPGPGALRCLEWVGAWRACYPQFEDLIFEKATTLVLKDGHAHQAANIEAGQPAAAPAPMDERERGAVRLQFVDLDDPTPDDLAQFIDDHPAMGDELTELATTMSVTAYLRMPPLPPLRAEKIGDRRRIDAMVERITSGRAAEAKETASATRFGDLAMPTGAVLRDMRSAALASHAVAAQARRPKEHGL